MKTMKKFPTNHTDVGPVRASITCFPFCRLLIILIVTTGRKASDATSVWFGLYERFIHPLTSLFLNDVFVRIVKEVTGGDGVKLMDEWPTAIVHKDVWMVTNTHTHQNFPSVHWNPCYVAGRSSGVCVFP